MARNRGVDLLPFDEKRKGEADDARDLFDQVDFCPGEVPIAGQDVETQHNGTSIGTTLPSTE